MDFIDNSVTEYQVINALYKRFEYFVDIHFSICIMYTTEFCIE